MKKCTIIFMAVILFTFLSKNIYATTNFNVQRKSLKIYDKFNISQILTTDSKNLKYTSSDENIATIDKNGMIFTKKQGQFIINVTDENSSTSCTFSSGYYVGIDVSSWNNAIDWKKVKKSGVDFAMIRSSYGWYDEETDKDEEYDFQYDKKLLDNLKGASENEISFGIYHFSYAKNKEEALLEAEYVLNAIGNYGKEYKEKMSLPIAYDVEYISNLSQKELTDIVITFCSKIYEAGYTPIVYSNKNFFVNHLDVEKLNALAYNLWYANYQENPDFSEKITIADTNVSPMIWQYTQSGDIDGANTDDGHVDLDILYMKDRVKITIENEGKIEDIIGVDKGTKVSELPVLSKIGYTFGGYKDKNGNSILQDYVYTKDITLVPVFKKIPITAIIPEKEKIDVVDKKTYKININKVEPETAILDGEELVYESDDTTIATVDKDGNVTPLKDGICNIKCYIKSNHTISTNITVDIHLGYIRGDLDKNGIVDANDAAIALDLYKYNNVTDEQLKIADIDKNGIIDANDAALILDIYKYGN